MQTRDLKMANAGGMAVQRAVAERWKQVTGVPIMESYGLTETSPAAISNPLGLEDWTGTIGVPIPSTEAAILNDQGVEVAMGEVDEICIRGPQVMKGYWNRPDETAKVLTADGWLRTGDMGFMDPRGYFKITDRKKDMIIVSGFKVFPNEIEDVVMMHPGVLEAAAIGVQDERSGEAVKVIVVRKDPALTEQESARALQEEPRSVTRYRRSSSSGPNRCRSRTSARSCDANYGRRCLRRRRWRRRWWRPWPVRHLISWVPTLLAAIRQRGVARVEVRLPGGSGLRSVVCAGAQTARSDLDNLTLEYALSPLLAIPARSRWTPSNGQGSLP